MNRYIKIKTKRPKLKLYKMEFSSMYNKSLSPRTEYIQSRIKIKELLDSAKLWCRLSGTEYYGYTDVRITEQTSIPEIASVTIDVNKLISKKHVDHVRKRFLRQIDVVTGKSPKELKRKLRGKKK